MADKEQPCYVCSQVPEPRVEAVYVSEYLVKNRTVTIKNIKVLECACGMMPEFWALAPLLRGVIASPDIEQTWEFIDGKWVRED